MLYLSFEECRHVNIWFRVGIGLLVGVSVGNPELGVKSVIYNHQYSYLLSYIEQRRKQIKGNHVQVKMIGHIKAKIKNQNYSQFLKLRKFKTYSSTRCELFPANFIFYNLYMPCTSYSVYRYIKKKLLRKVISI